MSPSIRLPRVLADAVNTDVSHQVASGTLSESLSSLFDEVPGLRSHILDDRGEIRPHVSVFVDGEKVDLGATVGPTSDVRVINAVSGG